MSREFNVAGREARGYFFIGIKTKLDSANRFPIRHADTPVRKRSLYQKAEHLKLRLLFFNREMRS